TKVNGGGRHRGKRMQPRREFGYDTEVAAPATQGPEQVWLVVRIGRHDSAVGEHDLGRQQVVDAETDHPYQGSVAAPERQPGETDRAHGAHRGRTTMWTRRIKDVAHGR